MSAFVDHSLLSSLFVRKERALISLTLFLSLSIILLLWLGYAGIATPLAFGIALVLTFVLRNKIDFTEVQAKGMSPFSILSVFGSMVLFLIIASVLFLGVQGGYDLSADAAPSIAAERITNQIPQTYTPYYDIPFRYQLGLPLIVSQLNFLSIPAHQLNWAFGMIGILMFLFFAAVWATRATGNPLAGAGVAVLFWGLRLPFLNLLVGEYPWLLALGMGFGVCLLARRSMVLGGIGFAALGIIHPYIALNFLILWIVLFMPKWKHVIQTGVVAGIAVLPFLVFQALSFLGGGGRTLEMGIPPLSAWTSIPPLIGIVPLVVVGIFLIVARWGRGFVSVPMMRCVGLVGIGIGGYTMGSFFPGLSIAAKLLELGSIGLLVGGAIGLSALPMPKLKLKLAVLLVISILILVTATSLHSFVDGTKSNVREARFATEWEKQNPELARVVVLAHGGNKIAQYAHKIPLTPVDAHFVSIAALANTRGPEVRQLLDYHAQLEAINASQCSECAFEFPVEFVAVDTHTFPAPKGKTPVWTWDGFNVYART